MLYTTGVVLFVLFLLVLFWEILAWPEWRHRPSRAELEERVSKLESQVIALVTAQVRGRVYESLVSEPPPRRSFFRRIRGSMGEPEMLATALPLTEAEDDEAVLVLTDLVKVK